MPSWINHGILDNCCCGPAGPGPPRDQTLVLRQLRGVNLVLYVVVSSAAAVIIIVVLIVLCFIVHHRRHWYNVSAWTCRVDQTLNCYRTCCPLCLSVLRLLRSSTGSQDQLLLLSILVSSSSVLISGLDQASVSNRTLEILCSVSSFIDIYLTMNPEISVCLSVLQFSQQLLI